MKGPQSAPLLEVFPAPPIPQKSAKRNSQMEELPFPPLPYSENEWRSVLDEIRNLYLKEQFRQCSAHCINLLENVRGPVHNFYLVYLSFYAATCLELLARPLDFNSALKISLFMQARSYYQRTGSFIRGETASTYIVTSRDHRRHSSSSSATSSSSIESAITSATDSNFTHQHSSPHTSPVSSVGSSSSTCQDEKDRPGGFKIRPLRMKKVTFHPTLPTVASVSSFNFDATSHGPQKCSSILTSPKSLCAPSFQRGRFPINKKKEQKISTFSFDPNSQSPVSNSSSVSLERHASTFTARVQHHLQALDAEILSIQLSQDSNHSHKRKTKRSNLPSLFDHFAHFNSMSSLNVEVGIPEIVSERQARRRGARIQELKMRGLEWENGGRFDGRKYEVLCERALREVAYQRVWIDIKDV